MSIIKGAYILSIYVKYFIYCLFFWGGGDGERRGGEEGIHAELIVESVYLCIEIPAPFYHIKVYGRTKTMLVHKLDEQECGRQQGMQGQCPH